MDEGDRLWLLGFGLRSVDYTSGIVTLSDKNGAGRVTRSELRQKLNSLSRSRGATNYSAPLESVREEMRSWDSEAILANPPILFFFTDGQLSLPDQHQPARHRDPGAIVEIVEELRHQGVLFQVVGLGSFQRDLLTRMGEVGGERPIFLGNPEQIMPAFWKLFAKVNQLFLVDVEGHQSSRNGDIRLEANVPKGASKLYLLATGSRSIDPFSVWQPNMQPADCRNSPGNMRCASGDRFRLIQLRNPPQGSYAAQINSFSGIQGMVLQQGGIQWLARSQTKEIFPGIDVRVDALAVAGKDTLCPDDYPFLADPSLTMILESVPFYDDAKIAESIAGDGILVGHTRLREFDRSHGFDDDELRVRIESSTMDMTVPVTGIGSIKRKPLGIKPETNGMLSAYWPFEHKMVIGIKNELETRHLTAVLSVFPADVELPHEEILVEPGKTERFTLKLPRSVKESALRLEAKVKHQGVLTGQVISAEASWRTVALWEWITVNPLTVLLALAAMALLLVLLWKRLKPRPALGPRFLQVYGANGELLFSLEFTGEEKRKRIIHLQVSDELVSHSGRPVGGVPNLGLRRSRKKPHWYEVIQDGKLLAREPLGNDVFAEGIRICLK